MSVISTAPGKLILTGEYAVLRGAPALVVAVNRRAIARRDAVRGSSPFLLAVAAELAERRGATDPAAKAALEIAVDSSAFYDAHGTKLGLGSSAAVTVAATACALANAGAGNARDVIFEIAAAAHARAQGDKGARGSGADIAAAVYGGTIVYTISARPTRSRWPEQVALVPFFTGAPADTTSLVAQVMAARESRRSDVDAALDAIGDASRAACGAITAPGELAATAVVAAMTLAGAGIDRLALATGVDLVPACVTRARAALTRLGGTAKTTGAGGGDVGVAVIPATSGQGLDASEVTRILIESGCKPLRLSVEETGVDIGPDAQ